MRSHRLAGSARSAARIIAIGAALALGAGPAVAGGDPMAGEKIAETCAQCHGKDGNSAAPTFPRLAGQYADYLEQSLRGYRSGVRANPIMAPFAANLSDQDIADLAAWFAGQEGDLYTIEYAD